MPSDYPNVRYNIPDVGNNVAMCDNQLIFPVQLMGFRKSTIKV